MKIQVNFTQTKNSDLKSTSKNGPENIFCHLTHDAFVEFPCYINLYSPAKC